MPFLPLFLGSPIADSQAARMSAFNFCNPFDHILPLADGTISALDRQHLWGMYIGIAAGAAIALTDDGFLVLVPPRAFQVDTRARSFDIGVPERTFQVEVKPGGRPTP